jgi:hypothetical protein
LFFVQDGLKSGPVILGQLFLDCFESVQDGLESSPIILGQLFLDCFQRAFLKLFSKGLSELF